MNEPDCICGCLAHPFRACPTEPCPCAEYRAARARTPFEHCPGCRKPLRWEYVEVCGGGDGVTVLPEQCFHYADCTCGYHYTLKRAHIPAPPLSLFDEGVQRG